MPSTTHTSCHINAPRSIVYRTLLDKRTLALWNSPDDMTCNVHEFDAHEGGYFRISLTYNELTETGKTTSQTDTYHGHFEKLVLNEQIVELVEFETENPVMQGEMTITYTLTDVDGGTDILVVHEGIPSGVSPADNENGTRMSLVKLATLVERMVQGVDSSSGI